MGPGQDHRRGPRATAGAGLQRLSTIGPAAGGGRWVLVPARRWDPFLDGVAARHGRFTVTAVQPEPSELPAGIDPGASVDIGCDDGTRLQIYPPSPPSELTAPLLSNLAGHVAADRLFAVVLLRRGNWAVGVFRGDSLLRSKVDSRLVQGRTAAGGQSQQRYARRRGNQADAALDRAVATTQRVTSEYDAELQAVFSGGDRPMLDRLFQDPQLGSLQRLRSAVHLEVGVPKLASLRSAADAARAVRVRIIDPSD